MWGEFFVEMGRYATMTGRGKDNTMYGDPTAFIDEIFDDATKTMKMLAVVQLPWRRHPIITIITAQVRRFERRSGRSLK